MLTHHLDPENHIVEITIDGKVSREELTEALEAFDTLLNEWEDIRVLKRVDSFKGMELMAWVDDFRFAFENIKNYKKIKKVALVTDKEWIENIAKFTQFLTPGEVKVFENEDIDEARVWLQ